MLQVLEQDPLPPRMLNPQADVDLEMIALKCLQKPADLRYQTADDLADDLEAYLGQRANLGPLLAVRPGADAGLPRDASCRCLGELGRAVDVAQPCAGRVVRDHKFLSMAGDRIAAALRRVVDDRT